MNRYIISLAAVAAVTFAMTGSPTTADAHPIHGPVVHHPVIHPHPVYYHGAYRFDRYQMRGYRGWSRWYWNARFGCYFYLCPTDNLWYYWYGPGNCYLPYNSIATYPPVVVNNYNVPVGVPTSPMPMPPGSVAPLPPGY